MVHGKPRVDSVLVPKMDWSRFLNEEAAFRLVLAWYMQRIAMDIILRVLSVDQTMYYRFNFVV